MLDPAAGFAARERGKTIDLDDDDYSRERGTADPQLAMAPPEHD